jgi:head-tail adaptor
VSNSRPQPTDRGGRWIAATVQQLVRGAPNELGEQSETWTFLATKFVRTTTIGVNERLAKERLRSDADIVDDVVHVVDMRWFEGLTSTDHRLVVNGLIFDITGLIDVDNLHRWWQITCNQTAQLAVPTIISVADANDGGVLVTFSLSVDMTKINPAGLTVGAAAGTSSQPASDIATEIGIPSSEPLSGENWVTTDAFYPGIPGMSGVVQ